MSPFVTSPLLDVDNLLTLLLPASAFNIAIDPEFMEFQISNTIITPPLSLKINAAQINNIHPPVVLLEL